MHLRPLFETLAAVSAFYLLFAGSGWGAARWIFAGKPKEYVLCFAPWIGILQTGILLQYFAFADWGAGQPIPLIASLSVGILSLFLSLHLHVWRDAGDRFKSALPGAAGVLLAAAIAMVPVYTQKDGLNSFTAGNNDILDYSISARLLQERGLKPFFEAHEVTKGLNPYDPRWKEALRHWDALANLKERELYAFLGYLPRWLPVQTLSFFSALTRQAPEKIYSAVCAALFALLLPLIWIFGRDVLKMDRRALAVGFAVASLNPHILYILYHGFLPQILGTGYILCFWISFPAMIESSRFDRREILAASAAFCGLLMVYQQAIPFIGLGAVLFLTFQSVRSDATGRKALALKAILILAVAIVFCPYHVWSLIPLMLSEFTQSVQAGGWPITTSLYGLPYQLGVFLSRASIAVSSPSLPIEAVLNPVLIALLAYGLFRLERKVYAICIALPFVAAAGIGFAQGKNYMYFKNFTLIYFLAPLLIAHGGFALRNRNLKTLAGALLGVIALVSGLKSADRIRLMARQGLFVPLGLSELKNVGITRGDRILASGLNAWDRLWARAYSDDAEVDLPYRRPTDTASPDGAQFILMRKNLNLLLDPLWGRTVHASKPVSRDFEILEASAASRPYVLLGEGFFDIERNGAEEWAWSESQAGLWIVSPAKGRARLAVEVEPLQAQRITVEMEGGAVLKDASLEPGRRNSLEMALELGAGANRLTLVSQSAGARAVPDDPRALSMRFFSLKVSDGEVEKLEKAK